MKEIQMNFKNITTPLIYCMALLLPLASNVGYASERPIIDSNPHQIYVAGGCFWGVEEYFSRISGVIETKVGYANGHIENPTYQIVSSGRSGSAEAVYIKYDANKISLEILLKQFFKIINPLSKNKQGNDVGSQYRTGIYYQNEHDLITINTVVNEVQEKYSKPIQTEILPLIRFDLAEEYHQHYLKKHPNGYCHISFDSLDDINK